MLRVYNRIYQEVFNQEWVEKQLNKLRPYSRQLDEWVASDYRDESQLLQGQALKDAQSWAKGKVLSNQDHRFLAASEERNQQEMQNLTTSRKVALHGVVSLLDDTHHQAVQELWAELAERFGLKGLYTTPFPHFSYNVAEAYEIEQLELTLQRIAHRLSSFQVRACGLGLFTGKTPVLYVPIIRNSKLTQLHRLLWEEIPVKNSNAVAYYHPENWVPHIPLALGDTHKSKLAEVIDWLSDREINWEITVSNLSFIQQTENGAELRFRFEFGNG
jgi:2'-5' RNA ligase